ncbi:histidine phosphatase family protein, partial [Mycobacterium tuberculosis]|uniref:histidine phosphatase family protein n=1 Tax=Mycobacterium tuberculosis TaxID=1773 RepID=UPI0030135073
MPHEVDDDRLPVAATTDRGHAAGTDEPPATTDSPIDSQLIRTQQTAAPLANLLGMAPQVLPGLNEIHAGIFEDLPQ